MIHRIAYTLCAGFFFWLGTESVREPVQPYRIVRPQPQLTPALTPICDNLAEIRQACTDRKRSDLIRQINPNTKGRM